ncbi:MAG: DUF433 domain-containing protein [Actinomycetota bacterium]|jgi:uncharacterized protein (DUF433 family)|nr:DUF433 domain-containing protein [Actinomycetota bacterium]
MKQEDVRIVSRHPGVLNGDLVFAGTRVPVRNLIDYPAAGDSLDDFLEGFPGVSREQVEGYLRMTLEVVEGSTSAGVAR